jgi:hypothetical protein
LSVQLHVAVAVKVHDQVHHPVNQEVAVDEVCGPARKHQWLKCFPSIWRSRISEKM